MGVNSREFVIDAISVSILQNDSKVVLSYNNKDINEELFDLLKKNLDDGKLLRLEMSNTGTDLSMSIFCENGLSHFGIIDLYNEVNYYYDNCSGDSSLVPIDGQVFEKWMVCEDNTLLWEAIMFFAHNGERSLRVTWKEE